MTNDYANMIMISWVMKGGGAKKKKSYNQLTSKFICRLVSRFDFKDIFFIYFWTTNNFG